MHVKPSIDRLDLTESDGGAGNFHGGVTGTAWAELDTGRVDAEKCRAE